MVTVAFTVPILPGKTESWLAFVKELNGPRRAEALVSHERAGIHREQTFLSSGPTGDSVLVVMEMDGPEGLRARFAQTGPFDEWFRAKVQEIHGMDVRELVNAPLIHPTSDLKR